MSFQPTWYEKISHTYENYKKGSILIAKDVGEKGAKNFAFFPNTKILEEYISTSSEKHFYDCYYYSSKENIKNYPVKLGFDIDIEGEIDSSLKDTIVNTIYEKVQYELFQYYNKTSSSNDIVVLDSSGLKDNGIYKTSFHIVIKGKYFENQKKVEMFVKFHLEDLFENSVLGLDKCIYATYHFLRIMNCSKRE